MFLPGATECSGPCCLLPLCCGVHWLKRARLFCPQGVDHARAAGQSALQRMGVEAGASRPLPSLQALFATPVEPLEDDIDYMPE